jgi:glycosyltransferase involved in cell wall biosynthesis
VLVRDLALERWPSMDRYADALTAHIPDAVVPDGWSMAGPRYLRRYWTYPRALRHARGDLVHILDHSYAHCLRVFPGLPSVVTVHDLFPLRVLSRRETGLRAAVRNALLSWVLRWLDRADRLIVSTPWAAREVTRYLGTPPERVHVVSYGVDPSFLAPTDPASAAARRRGWCAQLGRTNVQAVLLHVGSCEPRKNVEAVLGALVRLRRGGLDAILVQVGGTFSAAHRAIIAREDLAGHVVQERRVTEDALITAYRAADVLVLPSSFEGFGLPALEAMGGGLPVVTSGAGGSRDAVGDAAVVTGTLDGDALADAVAALLADETRRITLIARGRERAAAHSWPRAAADTVRVYAQLLHG